MCVEGGGGGGGEGGGGGGGEKEAAILRGILTAIVEKIKDIAF